MAIGDAWAEGSYATSSFAVGAWLIGAPPILPGMDITPSQAMAIALKNQGFTGALSDLQLQWLVSLGFVVGTVTDRWIAMLNDASIPDGGFAERLVFFYETELGLTPGTSGKAINELKRDYWLTQ